MLRLEFSNQFKKDFRPAIKKGCNQTELWTVVSLLQAEKPLPEKYRDHDLSNSRNYKDMRECHIQPDWLLVYKVYQNTLSLRLIRTGTHSDLFLRGKSAASCPARRL